MATGIPPASTSLVPWNPSAPGDITAPSDTVTRCAEDSVPPRLPPGGPRQRIAHRAAGPAHRPLDLHARPAGEHPDLGASGPSAPRCSAAVAAGSDVVQAWRAEEPRCVAAPVMHTRVMVERTMRAHREGHQRTQELWQEAWEACQLGRARLPGGPGALGVPAGARPARRGAAAGGAPGGTRRGRCCSPARGGCWRRPTGAIRTTARRTTGCCSSCTRGRPAARCPRRSTSCSGRPRRRPRAPRCTCCRCTSGSSATARERGHEKALDLHWVTEDAARDAAARAAPLVRPRGPADQLAARSQPSGPRPVGRRSSSPTRPGCSRRSGPYYTPLPWAYRTSARRMTAPGRGRVPARPEPLSRRGDRGNRPGSDG